MPMSSRQYKRGQQIISRASTDRNVYVVLSGRVRVSVYSPGGKVLSFRDLAAGSTFGEISAIDGQPRSANVEALDDCTIVVMSPQLFWTRLRSEPEFLELVVQQLAATIRSLSDRLLELATFGVQNRVYAEILRLARDAGPAGQTARIAPVPKHAEIASRIGANREQVTKELSSMARAGLIVKTGKTLVVPDVAKLERLIG